MMTKEMINAEAAHVARALASRVPEDVWEDRYKPMMPPSGDSLWTVEEVAGVSTNRVWTIMDSELDDAIIAVPGKRWANRIDYVVTEIPWETEQVVGIWCDGL